jgi:hypothetical protein
MVRLGNRPMMRERTIEVDMLSFIRAGGWIGGLPFEEKGSVWIRRDFKWGRMMARLERKGNEDMFVSARLSVVNGC